MNVKFYNISAPPEKVKKITSETSSTTVENVIFFEDGSLDILKPKIKLTINSEISQNLQYNYCYIPKTGRYYYITGIHTEGGQVIFDLTVDVLQSWNSDILSSTQYIIRSEKFNNRMIVDTMLPMHSDHNLLITPFGNDVFVKNCDHVILETIGKGGTVS